MESWHVLQLLIPNMWQLVLANIPVEGRVIASDEHDLLNSPGDALGLPIHCGKTVQLDGMTYGVGVVINREGRCKCSLDLSPKVLPVSLMYSTVHVR